MFRKIIPCCLGLFICLGSLGYANGFSPRVGEVLDYKVVVKSIIHGADQTVKVVSKGTYNGRDVYNIHSEMMTVGLVKRLYNYSQVEDLVLDAEGLYPWYIKLETTQGKDFKQEEIHFDYQNRKAIRSLVKNSEPKENKEINLPGYIQDQLSLQFFLRKDQVVNSVDKINFYENGKIKESTYSVSHTSQDLRLECGNYPKYIRIVDDVSKISVFVTDNPERLPVIVRSITDIGTIEMKLSKIK